MKCSKCYMSVSALFDSQCADCQSIEYELIKERLADHQKIIEVMGKAFMEHHDSLQLVEKILGNQNKAIIQLSQFMGQLKHNSGGLRPSPNFDNNIEEEIIKILK